MTQQVWDRGIVVSSAYAANAIPVAEYALAATPFSLKHAWHTTWSRATARPAALAVRLALLRPFDLRVLAYDPYLTTAEEELLDVERVPLAEVFRRCDVVSLHAPLLDETVGLITGEHLAAMKPGEIVRQNELIDVAQRRPDLRFVLDVTEPEPLTPDSRLYALENVVLTPHIAGSVGHECRRMGRYMVEELKRYLAGEPQQWMVTPELAAISSHRPLHGKLSVTIPAHVRGAGRRIAPMSGRAYAAE
jgi:phosphoglycerate dehydrogenase-like enzyme